MINAIKPVASAQYAGQKSPKAASQKKIVSTRVALQKKIFPGQMQRQPGQGSWLPWLKSLPSGTAHNYLVLL